MGSRTGKAVASLERLSARFDQPPFDDTYSLLLMRSFASQSKMRYQTLGAHP
jgi:hypothetical protein